MSCCTKLFLRIFLINMACLLNNLESMEFRHSSTVISYNTEIEGDTLLAAKCLSTLLAVCQVCTIYGWLNFNVKGLGVHEKLRAIYQTLAKGRSNKFRMIVQLW